MKISKVFMNQLTVINNDWHRDENSLISEAKVKELSTRLCPLFLIWITCAAGDLPICCQGDNLQSQNTDDA
jgi:hypothetical protein